MKAFLTVVPFVLVGCASQTGQPGALYPFTFVGIVDRVSDRTHMNVHGPEGTLVVKILEVTRGSYDRSEIAFGFPADSAPFLELGKKYRIRAAWGYHGMVVLDAKLLR